MVWGELSLGRDTSTSVCCTQGSYEHIHVPVSPPNLGRQETALEALPPEPWSPRRGGRCWDDMR